MTNQDVPKKFEPGVQKFLDDEETKEILQEYRSTTSIRGYRSPIIKYRSEKHEPITTFSPEIWEKFGMNKDFNFVNIVKEVGLADDNGNIIFEGKPTPTLKQIWVLALIHIKAVKIYTKSFINPKSSISFDGEKYVFGSGDIKNFIIHHFPNQLDVIKKLNATDVMKSLLIGFENNPCRGHQSIGILSVEKKDGLKHKRYYVEDIINLFSFDQIMRVLNISKKRPHYTKRQYNDLLDQLLKIPTPQKIDDPSGPLDLTPDLTEESESRNEIEPYDFDDSIPPAIGIQPETKPEDVNIDQVINITALKKILGNGDSVTITIQYTKSSSGE